MNNKNNKDKAGFLEMLAAKASLPSDSLAGEARIELRGRNTLFMQGCRRILKYSPEEMVMAAKGFAVIVKGERLVCSTYHDGAVSIDGMIASVELDSGNGKE
jgi:sporulation protein YqfC